MLSELRGLGHVLVSSCRYHNDKSLDLVDWPLTSSTNSDTAADNADARHCNDQRTCCRVVTLETRPTPAPGCCHWPSFWRKASILTTFVEKTFGCSTTVTSFYPDICGSLMEQYFLMTRAGIGAPHSHLFFLIQRYCPTCLSDV